MLTMTSSTSSPGHSMFIHNTEHFTLLQQGDGLYVLWSRDLDRLLFRGSRAEVKAHVDVLALELDDLYDILGKRKTATEEST